jgi:MFS family permease
MERLLILILGLSVINMAYGLYYTVSRPLFGVDLYGAWMVLYLYGAEYAPSLFSFLLGALGDSIGRRKLMAIGLVGAIPPFAVFTLSDWRHIVASVGLFYLFSGLVSTMAISGIIEDRARVGSKYSLAGLGMGIGWGISSLIAWPLFRSLDRYLFATVLATLYATGTILVVLGYTGKEREEGARPISALETVFTELYWFTPVILFSSIGLSVASSVTAILLDYKVRELGLVPRDIDPRLLYGLFYGTLPVLAGVPARFIAGRLVDRGVERHLLLASIVSYLALFLALPFTPPLLYVLLWIIPIYPFYDTSIYAVISRSTRMYEATSTGFLASVNSLAGVLIILLNTITPIRGIADYVIQVSVFLGLSLASATYTYIALKTCAHAVSTIKQ